MKKLGFRKGHGTIEEVHRVVNCINKALDENKFCTAIFPDISQAFDKVWHDGLLFKLREVLSINIFLKSYLYEESFFNKQEDEFTNLHATDAGVPQGSVLGAMLYLLLDLPIPQIRDVAVDTFADDTVALSVDKYPAVAYSKLQQVRTNIDLADTLIPSSFIYLIYMGGTGPCDSIKIIFGYHVNS